MPLLTPHSLSTAPPGARPALEQIQKGLGFIPNLYATLAESPALLRGVLALAGELDTGDLTAGERQVTMAAVSVENECSYCVAVHSTLAGTLRVPADVVTAVRRGAPVPDAKLDALVAFTRAVVRERGWVNDAAVAAFLAAGYTKAQLLEVVGLVGLKTIHNYAHRIADFPLDSTFLPQAWQGKTPRAA